MMDFDMYMMNSGMSGMMDFDRYMMDPETIGAQVGFDSLYPVDMDRNKLISKESKKFDFLSRNYHARKEHIKRYGFPIITREFADELYNKLNNLGVDTFVEIEAGHGLLTALLNNFSLRGIGYTLDPSKMEHNWGMEEGPITERLKEAGLLEYQDIRKITLDEGSIPDLVVASWIPYRGGDEVIEFFEHQPKRPKYFLIIGEDAGGCNANDRFFEWLDKNYEHVWTSEEYQAFDAIYDSCQIFESRG